MYVLLILCSVSPQIVLQIYFQKNSSLIFLIIFTFSTYSLKGLYNLKGFLFKKSLYYFSLSSRTKEYFPYFLNQPSPLEFVALATWLLCTFQICFNNIQIRVSFFLEFRHPYFLNFSLISSLKLGEEQSYVFGWRHQRSQNSATMWET